jgi:hypothetical protein
MTPNIPDSVINLLVDQTNLIIELDAGKIGTDGLIAELNLTGKLVSYSPQSHTEIFTLTVYNFKCIAQATTYLYRVGN